MSSSSRREFFVRTAVLGSIARAAFARDPLTHDNLGFQIYTLRSVIERDPLAILKAVQQVGYRDIECTAGNLDKIWPALQQTSLRPISLHTDASMMTPDGGLFNPAALDMAKQRGFKYLVIPSLETGQGGAEALAQIIERLNRQGEQVKNAGMTLCYHNHAHDFAPVNGTPAIETLLQQTNPKYVFLEMDIFWVVRAGHDPVAALKAHKGRVPLLHLKDQAPGTPVAFDEKVPHSAFMEVGSGSINIPSVLSAANDAGVRYYFVEQDQTAGDPIISLKKSFEYLKRMFNNA
ncbi:MAG TPA: TIM barrel protein [Bryobacteraceae bacterium]|jgi:sugar phosphate isomerase/epimerase|nr:TIM barrel protein [Bryobacteraceae bacterium]